MKKDYMPKIPAETLRYLHLLARNFPNIAAASTEIINLEAILNLPKGTEHFLADLHGEYEAFQHVLRNASGAIKRKVREIFGETLSMREQKELCTLIYYPEQKLDLVKHNIDVNDELTDWYFITLNRLVAVCRNVSSKYTRSKVRKALPTDYAYIIQELLHENSLDTNKQAYVEVIVRTIISTHRADDFIISICNLIQQLAIDSLHILGDVFDRGPQPHKIMDILCEYHNFDFQWGNHDILWMGAACGNDACMANVLRIAMRYANHNVIEDGYGINLLPLATFAMETYADDPCTKFMPKLNKDDSDEVSERQTRMLAQMHKAIAIIQFKLEAQVIKRHPEYKMDDRLLLHLINKEEGTINLNGTTYELNDKSFPTLCGDDPYALTEEEQDVVAKLHRSFISSEKLQRHVTCLFTKGSLFTICNSNLLYHASVPLNEDGTLKDVMVAGEYYHGKELLQRVDAIAREAFFGTGDKEYDDYAIDFMWYLWCGPDSPTFDKDKMATFERYFINDKESHKEVKGAYYHLRDEEKVIDMILDDFKVQGTHRHIINGHVPVKLIKGEQPVKANGKLMVIDGGFSKAYQPETGIAGYTLVFHSRGFQLVQHEPFTSITKAVEEGQDIKSTTQLVEMSQQRMMVKDTDLGKELERQVEDLNLLLDAFHAGIIKEHASNTSLIRLKE